MRRSEGHPQPIEIVVIERYSGNASQTWNMFGLHFFIDTVSTYKNTCLPGCEFDCLDMNRVKRYLLLELFLLPNEQNLCQSLHLKFKCMDGSISSDGDIEEK